MCADKHACAATVLVDGNCTAPCMLAAVVNPAAPLHSYQSLQSCTHCWQLLVLAPVAGATLPAHPCRHADPHLAAAVAGGLQRQLHVSVCCAAAGSDLTARIKDDMKVRQLALPILDLDMCVGGCSMCSPSNAAGVSTMAAVPSKHCMYMKWLTLHTAAACLPVRIR